MGNPDPSGLEPTEPTAGHEPPTQREDQPVPLHTINLSRHWVPMAGGWSRAFGRPATIDPRERIFLEGQSEWPCQVLLNQIVIGISQSGFFRCDVTEQLLVRNWLELVTQGGVVFARLAFYAAPGPARSSSRSNSPW